MGVQLYQAPQQPRQLDYKRTERIVKGYLNSAEFSGLMRMMIRAQVMMSIVTVLFWLVMIGLVVFCVWVCLLPQP